MTHEPAQSGGPEAFSAAADGRGSRATLIGTTLIASWYGMQAVHEAGHALAAWATGGTVEGVVLPLLSFSRTDVGENPHPLLVVWAGPIFGSLAPVLSWLLAAVLRAREAFLVRFFSGFCLVANGGYLIGGSLAGDGDCGDLLRLGMPIWALWVAGAAAIVPGLALWHGQGRHFGIGTEGTVSRRAVIASTLAAGTMLALVLAMGRD